MPVLVCFQTIKIKFRLKNQIKPALLSNYFVQFCCFYYFNFYFLCFFNSLQIVVFNFCKKMFGILYTRNANNFTNIILKSTTNFEKFQASLVILRFRSLSKLACCWNEWFSIDVNWYCLLRNFIWWHAHWIIYSFSWVCIVRRDIGCYKLSFWWTFNQTSTSTTSSYTLNHNKYQTFNELKTGILKQVFDIRISNNKRDHETPI